MDHSAFMDVICKKLQKMPPERKDAWIIEQAKMVSESEQQDFIMALSGEKKVIYMPAEREIDELILPGSSKR